MSLQHPTPAPKRRRKSVPKETQAQKITRLEAEVARLLRVEASVRDSNPASALSKLVLLRELEDRLDAGTVSARDLAPYVDLVALVNAFADDDVLEAINTWKTGPNNWRQVMETASERCPIEKLGQLVVEYLDSGLAKYAPLRAEIEPMFRTTTDLQRLSDWADMGRWDIVIEELRLLFVSQRSAL